MKKWFAKLKESDNYNSLISAMLVVIAATFVLTIIVAGNNIRQVVLWDMNVSEGLVYIVPSFLVMVFLTIGVYFVVQACVRDPKFMICAIACLVVAAVFGGFIGAIAGVVLGAIWFVSGKNKNDKRWEIVIKVVAIMLMTIVIVTLLKYVCMIFVIGNLGEWGTDSLEEGDWSQWETEETLNDSEWITDEAVDEIYYDEDGNGSTSVTFEFE